MSGSAEVVELMSESRAFVQVFLDQLASGPTRAHVTEVRGAALQAFDGRALAGMIARARGALRARGVKPGDRVGLLAPNSAQWVAADVALLAEGSVVVPLYARQEPAELVAMMHDAGVTLVVCGTTTLADGVRKHWPEVDVVALDALFDGAAVDEPAVTRAPGDCVTIVYTSGTSGEPKGVMITGAGVDHMLPVTRDGLRDLMGANAGQERVFHYLPFCFMGSRIVLWTALYRAGGIFVSTNLENLAEELKTAKPHYFLNVPALLERIKKGVEAKLCTQPRLVRALYARGVAAYLRSLTGDASALDRAALALARRVVFARVRQQIGADLVCLICGSAPLHPDTQRWFEMLGIPVYQVYGLTETTAIVTMDIPGQAAPGRVGVAIRGVEMRLGEGDELQVRGPNVFAGYWQRTEATAAAFVDATWFRTGDQCAIDARGNLEVIGRVGNLLVAESGHNIAPEPIEAKILAELGAAENCVVLGHGRPFLTAIVTGKVASGDVQQALDRVNATLPHYRRVRAFHVSREPFTIESGLLTANQKLRRRAIEKHYATAVQELYA